MNINLSSTELELIKKSLEAYVNEPPNLAFTKTVIASVLCPNSQEMEQKCKAKMTEAGTAQDQRRREVVLLQAKIIQHEDDLLSVI